ncbi:MAG TPA: methionyl-tRNA formyltransferase [Acidobacteria bacterium]|nr:methionyl-tRNA formyltransferase [Acidobacteriota bacterium]
MVTIVFFGTPPFAVPSLERLVAGGERVAAAVTQPDRRRGRGQRLQPSAVKSAALAHGIPVLQPARASDPAFLAQLSALQPDLGVVAAYGKMLPDSVLHAPRLGTINVHASLLPKYRGAAPVHRAIMAGERETGITMIRLVRQMDAGPMLARVVHPIGEDETSEMAERALAALGADLLLTTVAALASGQAIEEEQDHARATLAPRLTREDGRVDWAQPADTVRNLIRGLHPWPHAYTFLHGTRYLLLRATVASRAEAERLTAPAPVGTIIEAHGDRLHLACGEKTVLALHEVQPEGRKRLSTRAFLAGRPIALPAAFQSGAGPA